MIVKNLMMPCAKRVLVSVYLSMALLALLASLPVAAGEQRDERREGDAQVLRPALLPDDQPIDNPMSGFYAATNLQPQFTAPLPVETFETYEEIYWSCLENRGAFDFSLIDKALASLPQGVRFAFRVKAFDPSQIGAPQCRLPNVVPNDLETDRHGFRLPFDPTDFTKGSYFVPDWNDPVLLQRLQSLLSALGQRYDHDPRLAFVDIGYYGSFGEWHTQGLPHYPQGVPYRPGELGFNFNTRHLQPGTVASKVFIVDAHVAAFPSTQLVMLTDDGDALCHALRLEPESHIGLRRDSLGSGATSWTFQFPDHLPGCDTADDVALILDRWKVAPFVTEPFGGLFPRTFTLCPKGATQEFCIDQEVPQFHVTLVKNAGLGVEATGSRVLWSALPAAEQQAFLSAGFHAGYRFAPIAVRVSEVQEDVRSRGYGRHRHRLSVATSWSNTGITPAYNLWQVEFSLWRLPERGEPPRHASFVGISRVDLQSMLPTGAAPVVIRDDFALPRGLGPGLYEFKVTIIDPHRYLNPLHLALQHQAADGGYSLGDVRLQGRELDDDD